MLKAFGCIERVVKSDFSNHGFYARGSELDGDRFFFSRVGSGSGKSQPAYLTNLIYLREVAKKIIPRGAAKKDIFFSGTATKRGGDKGLATKKKDRFLKL